MRFCFFFLFFLRCFPFEICFSATCYCCLSISLRLAFTSFFLSCLFAIICCINISTVREMRTSSSSLACSFLLIVDLCCLYFAAAFWCCSRCTGVPRRLRAHQFIHLIQLVSNGTFHLIYISAPAKGTHQRSSCIYLLGYCYVDLKISVLPVPILNTGSTSTSIRVPVPAPLYQYYRYRGSERQEVKEEEVSGIVLTGTTGGTMQIP